MAKSKSKETSLPLIIALIFFILSTIGLGVFCYTQFAEIDTATAAKAEAEKTTKQLRTELRERELEGRVQRIFFGVEKDDDRATVETDVKEGDPAFQHLEWLVATTKAKTAKASKDNAAAFEAYVTKTVDDGVKARATDPKAVIKLNLAAYDYKDDLAFWDAKIDPKTSQLVRPTGNLLDVIVRSKLMRDLALKQAADDKVGYEKGVASSTQAAAAAKKEGDTFSAAAKTLPDEYNMNLAAAQAAFDKRKRDFDTEITKLRGELSAIKDDLDKTRTDKKRLQGDVDQLNLQMQSLLARQKPADPLKFDEPQGKVTRRLGDNVVEIDVGSSDRVREGLTFSVLGSDYPALGEQSRMKKIRVPDGRGNFRDEVVFIPKAKIEIIEVLGPNSSKAKITEEFDDIRDKAMPGDLLYSAAWRKGQPERIALIGIFDVNGDGSDDLEAVVRDLRKMGVLVDAYYDPNKKNEDGSFGGWVGKIGDQTRYIVKGYFPDPAPNDPNLAKMSDLNGRFTKGLNDARVTGAPLVGLKDFFPRMGYKIRMDVTDDHIRQAARKYLDPVAAAAPVVNPNPDN